MTITDPRAFAVRSLLRIRASRRHASEADLSQAERCALTRLAAGVTASAAITEADRLYLPKRPRIGLPTLA